MHPTTLLARYNLGKLVYSEYYKSEVEAKLREKQMKKRNRAWEIELIKKSNPDWMDLYRDL